MQVLCIMYFHFNFLKSCHVVTDINYMKYEMANRHNQPILLQVKLYFSMVRSYMSPVWLIVTNDKYYTTLSAVCASSM